jgi:hypothetical protein
LTFTISNVDHTVTYTGISSSSQYAATDLIIPDTVTGGGYDGSDSGVKYRVTVIGANCFKNCQNLNGTVTFPDTITTVGGNAFDSTQITDAIFPSFKNANSLSLMQSSFVNCTQLEYVKINSYKNISLSSSVFDYCSNFHGFINNGDAPATISEIATAGCFKNCPLVPENIQPSNIKLSNSGIAKFACLSNESKTGSC